MTRAALYLRSSKDRKDVSLDTQRRDLEALAQARGLQIVEEYSDVVESGKDTDRPGYQRLLAAISNRNRGWTHLLILDTSRLARRQHIAVVFSEECRKRGIRIHYAKIPELDPINEILVMSVMRAMDEMHSHSSKEKGLAGMAENVRKGFRAGGRAPLGYQLKSHDIGIVREGKAVLKTSLEIATTEIAGQAAAFMRARAGGAPRALALRQSGLKINPSTAVGMEWNALTYAGCTVWNVHRELGKDGYGDEGKRRPRSEWQIKENTHPAIITRDEAERLLQALENSDVGRSVSLAKRSVSGYLLASFLRAPDGTNWEGAGKADRAYRYRGRGGMRGKLVAAAVIERAVIEALTEHLGSDRFINALFDSAQGEAPDTSARKQKHAELVGLTAKIDRAVEGALFLDDPAPMYRKVDALERDRKRLVAEIAELKQEEEMRLAAGQISKVQIRELLGGLTDNLAAADPMELKGLLGSFIDKITLDPSSLEAQIHYRFAAAKWASVAFPPGFEPGLPP